MALVDAGLGAGDALNKIWDDRVMALWACILTFYFAADVSSIVDLSVGAGAVTMPWWVELTSGLELLIAVGGVALIEFRLAMDRLPM